MLKIELVVIGFVAAIEMVSFTADASIEVPSILPGFSVLSEAGQQMLQSVGQKHWYSEKVIASVSGQSESSDALPITFSQGISNIDLSENGFSMVSSVNARLVTSDGQWNFDQTRTVISRTEDCGTPLQARLERVTEETIEVAVVLKTKKGHCRPKIDNRVEIAKLGEDVWSGKDGEATGLLRYWNQTTRADVIVFKQEKNASGKLTITAFQRESLRSDKRFLPPTTLQYTVLH